MERVTDLLVECALHGVVAALAVELLIRRLPVLRLEGRARLRLFVLVFPLCSVPLFHLIAPVRGTSPFADVSLLASERWDALTWWGIPVRRLAFSVFALLGVVILLRDAVGDAAHALRRRGTDEVHDPGPWVSAPRDIVHELSAARGEPAPALVVVRRDEPVLLCRGFSRPRIAISHAIVQRLRADGLRAALAHELSHVRHGDPLRDVLLAVLRTLQWFNPVAQVVARRIAQETEWRADDEAVETTGNGPALARALLESVRARGGDFLGAFGRARIAALEIRCRRVLARELSHSAPGLSRLEFLVTGAALGVLAFLVR